MNEHRRNPREYDGSFRLRVIVGEYVRPDGKLVGQCDRLPVY